MNTTAVLQVENETAIYGLDLELTTTASQFVVQNDEACVSHQPKMVTIKEPVNKETEKQVPGVNEDMAPTPVVQSSCTVLGSCMATFSDFWSQSVHACKPYITDFTRCLHTHIPCSHRSNSKQSDFAVLYTDLHDLRWIGSGSSSAVFSAQYKGQTVAVKKLKYSGEMEVKEIKSLMELKHPNVVQCVGVVQHPFEALVMEYCGGGSLFEVLRKQEVDPPLIVHWATQIAHGMHYLHYKAPKKIIHRDLKSANILIGHNNVAKISDFGTAREFNGKTTSMSFQGTVAWMSPEVIRNEPSNRAVDVWSFGVVLWELLTGQVPYANVETSAIIWGVGGNSLHLPIPASCPHGFAALMRACWDPSPKSRPSFKRILLELDCIGRELVAQSNDAFFELQLSWRREIADKFFEMRCLEKRLREFAEELRQRETAVREVEEARRTAEAMRQHAEVMHERYVLERQRAEALMEELAAKERELCERERRVSAIEQRIKLETPSGMTAEEATSHELQSKEEGVSSPESPLSVTARNETETEITV
eukprot:Colp12_sorted_trinity150504_noHs@10977